MNTWDPHTQTLGYLTEGGGQSNPPLRSHVPARSHGFLQAAIARALGGTVNVLLLLGCNRYDVGTFLLVCYDPPTLQLRRQGGDEPPKDPPPPTTRVVASPRLAGVDSLLETEYRRLFAAWGVAVNYQRTMYHLEDDTTVTRWYTPDALLYDILADDAHTWCGVTNRHGRHCVVEIKPVYPAQDVFSKLRSLARLFHIPVVVLYGRPDVVPTDERMTYGNLQYSQGTMGILFRPGDGHTSRAHFDAWDDAVHLRLGEPGEHGPLHPRVVAGHLSLQSSGLLPRIASSP